MTAKGTRQWMIVFLCAAFVLAAATAGAQDRKIAVAADGPEIDASISERTARAPFILFFDGSGNLLESVENPITVDRRAGHEMAEWLAVEQVDAIIGGAIGPRMGQALAARQIQGIEKSGSVREAVKDVLE